MPQPTHLDADPPIPPDHPPHRQPHSRLSQPSRRHRPRDPPLLGPARSEKDDSRASRPAPIVRRGPGSSQVRRPPGKTLHAPAAAPGPGRSARPLTPRPHPTAPGGSHRLSGPATGITRERGKPREQREAGVGGVVSSLSREPAAKAGVSVNDRDRSWAARSPAWPGAAKAGVSVNDRDPRTPRAGLDVAGRRHFVEKSPAPANPRSPGSGHRDPSFTATGSRESTAARRRAQKWTPPRYSPVRPAGRWFSPSSDES